VVFVLGNARAVGVCSRGAHRVLPRSAVLGWGMCVCCWRERRHGSLSEKSLIVPACGLRLCLWIVCYRLNGCGVVILRAWRVVP
jgi:hypothetical protein